MADPRVLASPASPNLRFFERWPSVISQLVIGFRPSHLGSRGQFLNTLSH
jgi:hypothetical protein